MAHALLLAASAGVVSHLSFFNKGEHHKNPMRYIVAFLGSCAGAVLYFAKFNDLSGGEALLKVAALATSWLTGVYSSLLLYRLFLHPLRGFPGPWQARIGALWLSTQLGKLNGYSLLDDLHKQYGKYVRVGPNTLSVIDPAIMQPAFGVNTKVRKNEWYDSGSPLDSMHTTRDKGLHDRRRRVWAPGFSDKALRGYEPMVQEFNDRLTSQIASQQSQPLDMTTLFNLWSFSVMGRLAFGKDYQMLEAGKRHWALDLLTEGMETAGYRWPCWLFRLLIAIPGLTAGYYKFLKFCGEELTWRVKNGGQSKNGDITSWLLKAYVNEKHPEKDPFLLADTRLIIVAGSDTTSATLTHLFYHLAKNPEHVDKLRKELRPLTAGEWSDREIQNCEHLNGAINEALRLHPAVPSGLMRQTPPEGLQIGNTYIPGNVDFFVPAYSVGRSEDVYTDANEFVPERWYSKSEMVKHPDAFAPFSMGHYNCIGRNLARMELRTVTARLLLKFDVALAPGEDGTRLLTKTKDHFTITPGQLDLVWTPASS